MKNLQNFLISRTSRLLPLMAVFTLPCQGNEGLGECISQIYTVSLTLVGLVAFVEILWGGFELLTAAGNTSKTGQAMDKIKNAIFGIVLLFSSYLILKTINPDLVNFHFNLQKVGVSEQLANPNEFSRVDNFDVNPKTALLGDPLDFTSSFYLSAQVFALQCNNTTQPITSKVLITDSVNTRVVSEGSFSKENVGTSKVLPWKFNKTLQDIGVKTGEKSVTFQATLSCVAEQGDKELNRSSPVVVNIVH